MPHDMSPELTRKLNGLTDRLKALDSVLIAFSGGVDSTLLARVARDALGDKAAAVTARSETYPPHEYAEAVALARQIGIRHVTIETEELNLAGFRNNPPDRCYHCKRELFGKLSALAREMGLKHVLDGANSDDAGDFRPGSRAAAEFNVLSPLRELGFTKQDIRDASRALGLPTWNKPSCACLSSRFPYGQTITRDAVARVAKAEEFLHGMDIAQVRVRHYGATARIEVPAAEITRVVEPANRERIVARLRELGYAYVTLDLQGYRTGSMNEVLTEREKEAK
jgi:uncharacterized protein